MTKLFLSLLGTVQVTLDGQPIKLHQKKSQAILFYLISEPVVRRETLQSLLWENYLERSARTNFRSALYVLKKAIPNLPTVDGSGHVPLILSDKQTIQLNPAAAYQCDVATFTELLEQVEDHPHDDLLHCESCLDTLQRAAELYRGEFLADFYVADSGQFENWAAVRREEFRRQALVVLESLASVYLLEGHYDLAEGYARRQLEFDNLRESAHRQLMETMARSGRRRAALTHFKRCRQLLKQELGIEPSTETQLLYDGIIAGELEQGVAAQIGPGEPAHSLAQFPSSTSSPLPPFLNATEEEAIVETEVFVARDRELGQLDQHLEQALSGRGRVVFVTGEAGQGKTALLRQFAHRAQMDQTRLIVASGSCNAYAGIGDPYLPFRDVMVMLSGNIETRWMAGKITRDQALRLWRLFPLTAEAVAKDGPNLIDVFISGNALAERAGTTTFAGREWLERLKALIRTPQARSTDLEQRHLFEQFTNVLVRLAAQYPLLITLDDIQWADAASISLLFHLGRRLEGNRILIVGSYRPDEVALGLKGDRHPLEKLLAEFKRAFGDVWVELDQADEVEGREFVNALLDTEPNLLGAEFRQALFQKTGGHPLFTVELLQALKSRGDLARDAEQRWIMGQALDWRTLPIQIEGVLEERFGRLDQTLREVLMMASVEGESFTAEIVARVQGVSQTQILRLLSQELEKRHRLVVERETFKAGRHPLTRYRFTHVLFQQYLYHSLSAGERRFLHGEFAQALEALYEDQEGEIENRLANHFLKAGEREKALEYSRRAARRAQAIYAYDEAIHHLQTALDLLETDQQIEMHIALLEEIADIYSVFTTDTKAISYYQDALEILSGLKGGDTMTAVRLHRKILEFAFELHGNVALEFFNPLYQTLEPSRAYLEARLPMAQNEPPQLEWVRVFVALANFTDTGVRSQEDLEAAEGYALAAVKIAEQLGEPVELSDALGTLARIYFVRGLLPKQLEVAHRRLTLSQDPRFSDSRKRSHILESLSDALIAVGKYEEALLFLVELENLTLQIGAIVDHIWALGLQAYCLFRLDRWQEILRCEGKRQELERRYSSVQLGGGYCVILSLYAAVCALRGEVDQARVLREQAYDFMLGGADGPPDNWGRTEFY